MVTFFKSYFANRVEFYLCHFKILYTFRWEFFFFSFSTKQLSSCKNTFFSHQAFPSVAIFLKSQRINSFYTFVRHWINMEVTCIFFFYKRIQFYLLNFVTKFLDQYAFHYHFFLLSVRVCCKNYSETGGSSFYSYPVSKPKTFLSGTLTSQYQRILAKKIGYNFQILSNHYNWPKLENRR